MKGSEMVFEDIYRRIVCVEAAMINSLDPAILGLTLFDKSFAGAARTAKLGNRQLRPSSLGL